MGTAHTTSVEEAAPQPEVVAERAGSDGAGGPVAGPIALMWEALERLLPYVERHQWPYYAPDWKRMLRERSKWAAHYASYNAPEGPIRYAAHYASAAAECLVLGAFDNAKFMAQESRRYAIEALREFEAVAA